MGSSKVGFISLNVPDDRTSSPRSRAPVPSFASGSSSSVSSEFSSDHSEVEPFTSSSEKRRSSLLPNSCADLDRSLSPQAKWRTSKSSTTSRSRRWVKLVLFLLIAVLTIWYLISTEEPKKDLGEQSADEESSDTTSTYHNFFKAPHLGASFNTPHLSHTFHKTLNHLFHSEDEASISQLPSQRFNGLTHGRWIPPTKSTYNQTDSEKEWGIGAYSDESNGGPRRALATAAYRWQPVQDGGLRSWNGLEFAKRLLNSQSGMIMVGDSLTQQMVDVLWYMMARGTGDDDLKPGDFFSWKLKSDENPDAKKTKDGKKKAQRFTIRIRSDTPWFQQLTQEFPEVPLERYEEPIFSFYRDDTLLNAERLVEFAHELNLAPPDEVPTFLKSEPWQPELPTSATYEKRWTGEQNSILMLNTGAHLNKGELNMSSTAIDAITKLLARHVLSDLVTRPALDIVYRGTSPGHVNCPDAVTPIYPSTPYEDHPTYSSWDWGRFDRRNEMWAAEMDRLAPKGKVIDGSGSVAYLNITDMARQRPEAHVVNYPHSPDCLHWQLPGVPNYWIIMLWDMMSSFDRAASGH